MSEYLRHCKTTHSSRLYLPQLPCDRCHLVFNSNPTFYKHYKEHTESDIAGDEANINNTSKLLRCSHCNENFSFFDGFKTHVRKVYQKNGKINCPCCNKKELVSYRAFTMHYLREHKHMVQKQMQTQEHGQSHENNNLEYNEENTSTPDSDEQDFLVFHQEAEKLKFQLVASLLNIKNQHGISQAALNSILNVFAEHSTKSNQVALQMLKQKMSNTANNEYYCNNCIKTTEEFSKNHALNQILEQEMINTHSKRQTIVTNNFNLVEQKKIHLGYGRKNDQCYVAYNSPEALLKRFFEDKTVKKSFESFSKNFHDSSVNMNVYGDFFTSRYYPYS